MAKSTGLPEFLSKGLSTSLGSCIRPGAPILEFLRPDKYATWVRSDKHALALWARGSHGGGEGMVWCGSKLATSFSETTSKLEEPKNPFSHFFIFSNFFS